MNLISTPKHPSDVNVSELCSSVGVEFHPLGLTPFGELVRVYVHANNPDAFCLKSFAALFSSHPPLIVGAMQFVTILEHNFEPEKVLGLIPGHANSVNIHGNHQ